MHALPVDFLRFGIGMPRLHETRKLLLHRIPQEQLPLAVDGLLDVLDAVQKERCRTTGTQALARLAVLHQERIRVTRPHTDAHGEVTALAAGKTNLFTHHRLLAALVWEVSLYRDRPSHDRCKRYRIPAHQDHHTRLYLDCSGDNSRATLSNRQ